MKNYPKILLSSSEVSVPPCYKKQRTAYFDISEKIFETENVGTILNVAKEIKKNSLHDEMYSKYSINYIYLGINDGYAENIPNNFLDDIIRIYEEHISKSKDKAFLVNCQAGVNRSALAVGAILWKSRSDSFQWKTPERMIEDMRWFQKRDRDLDILLINKDFERYLINYCLKN